MKLQETGIKIPVGTTSRFFGQLQQCSSVCKPKFYQKLHQHLQCIKSGFKFVNILTWMSFSPLLAFLQPHQLLNGNQLSELMQRQTPHYFITIHEPRTLECLYSSTVPLLVTWGYQITSFPNQTYLDLFVILLLKRAFLLGSNNPVDEWKLCIYITGVAKGRNRA